jgi:hypothetical protein
VLAAAAAVALAALPGIASLRSDNRAAIYFQESDPALAVYRAARTAFGSDAALRIALSGPQLWSAGGVRYQASLEQRAARLAGVEDVVGLAGRHPGLEGDALREAAAADVVATGLGLVDGRGERATILLRLGADRGALSLAGLRALLASPPAGVSAELVGMAVLQEALDASTREIYRLSFPLLVAVSALLLAAVFRSPGGVLMPLAFVGLCEATLFGVMGYLGVRLNLVLAVLPPLVFTVALASAIHVLTRARALRESGLEREAAILATYRDKGRALAWTAASTCAGFGSLATSAVPPVRQLGLWAAFATIVLGGYAFLVLPALLTLADRPGGSRARPLEMLFQRAGAWAAEAALRHRAGVYLLLFVACAIAVAGLPRLRVESNALRYLSDEHPARSAVERLENSGIGVAAAELIATARPAAKLRSGAAMQRLSWIALRLREETAALHVFGAGDLVDSTLRASPEGRDAAGGSEPRAAALAALTEDPRGAAELHRFLSADGTRARLLVFLPTAGYEEVDRLLAGALDIARQEMPEAEWAATGEYPLLLSTQRSLLATLRSSLVVTLASILLILFLLLRSLRATALATIPNLVPVLLVLGAMAWLGVPVDIATVMVAATTLGLALDDTIHTLAHYRDPEPSGGGPSAVLPTLERNAAAYSITGLVLGLGFAVCALSSFVPIFRFGSLSAVAIAIAVGADFVLVPALLGGKSRGPAGAPGENAA